MRVEAVICSPNDQKFAAASQSLMSCSGLHITDIVQVPDARSMCEGYNRGGGQTTADWIVFCHDDIEVVRSNPATLARAFQGLDVFGVCGTARLTAPNWYDSDPNLLLGSVLAPIAQPEGLEHQIFGRPSRGIAEAQALDGIFIACRYDVWRRIRFDESLPGFTGYDIDFTYRAYLHGYRVGVIDDLILYHASHVGDFSPQKVAQWEANQAMLRTKFNFRGVSEGYVKHGSVQYREIEDFVLRQSRDET